MNKFNLLQKLKILSMKKSSIFIFIVVAFIILNLILSPLSLKIDFSKGKAYSLSKSTKKILSNLEKPITIKFFVSSDIPSKLIPLKNDVTDLLNEYKRQNGKVDLKIVDPKNDKTALADATSAGILELQYSQLDQDKYALSKVYFGILVSYQDKNEVISQVSDTASLEYNLTSAIYKLSNTDIAKIGIIGQQDVSDPALGQITSLIKVLRQQFDLSFSDKIESDAKTIFIFDDGKKAYSQEEIDSIKKYLNDGGKMVFFVDRIRVEDSLATSFAKNNLGKLFSDYGINLENNFVLSVNAEMVNFGNGTVSFLAPYPFWLKTNIFNNKFGYFSNISQVSFPWVSSISVNKKNGVEVSPLIQSTDRSWEQKSASDSGFILDPQKIPQPSLRELGKRTLAVDVKLKDKGEFILFPSSKFVLDKYMSQNSGNLGLILNITNDFASRGALSGIRQRQVSFYPLPDLSSEMKNVFKYSNIFLLPLAFALYGAFRLIKRK